MEPMDPNHLADAFARAKVHQKRALRKLGHPVTALDTSDERSAQSKPEPPADTDPDDPDQKPENRDRA
jgi:hypothetical protein